MKIEPISFRDWNKTINSSEVSKAHRKDILYKIDNVLFLCETKNECNNIQCYTETFDMKNIKRMFAFIVLLFVFNNIRYVTICGNLKRYKFLLKKFPNNVVQNTEIKDYNVFYVKLDYDVIVKLMMEIHK